MKELKMRIKLKKILHDTHNDGDKDIVIMRFSAEETDFSDIWVKLDRGVYRGGYKDNTPLKQDLVYPYNCKAAVAIQIKKSKEIFDSFKDEPLNKEKNVIFE